jgi:transposase-like protein
MSDADLIDLGFDRHEIKCPHCQRQTVHHSPGRIILLAKPSCVHCGGEFLVAMNEPRIEG